MSHYLLFTTIIILNFFSDINGQNSLTGKWQVKTNKISSAFLDSYSFISNDSTFIFTPSQYNGLNRVLEISGKYSLKQDSIFFYIKSTKEYVGGYPIRSRTTTLADTWELIDGKVELNSLPKIIEQSATFSKGFDNVKKVPYISIDGNLFYKTPDE